MTRRKSGVGTIFRRVRFSGDLPERSFLVCCSRYRTPFARDQSLFFRLIPWYFYKKNILTFSSKLVEPVYQVTSPMLFGVWLTLFLDGGRWSFCRPIMWGTLHSGPTLSQTHMSRPSLPWKNKSMPPMWRGKGCKITPNKHNLKCRLKHKTTKKN